MAHTSIKFKMTRADAVVFIKRQPAGVRFAVHLHGDAPVADSDDQFYPGVCKGFVSISRKDAARVAGDLISVGMEERGARVPLSLSEYVGESGKSVTLWIG